MLSVSLRSTEHAANLTFFQNLYELCVWLCLHKILLQYSDY